MANFTNWKEYLDGRGKLVDKPPVEEVPDYSGPDPKTPPDSDTTGMDVPLQLTNRSTPYRAPGTDPGLKKGEPGLSEKGDSKLIYKPDVEYSAKGKKLADWIKFKESEETDKKALGDKSNKNLIYDPDTEKEKIIPIIDNSKKKITKTEAFLNKTKDMPMKEFVEHMISECGCSDMAEEELPTVTAYAAGKFHPHPPEAIKYIVALAEKNARIMEALIHEIKRSGSLGKMLGTSLDHPESYDELTGLLGDEEHGPARSKALANSMDSSYTKFMGDQDDLYEGVAPPMGMDDEDQIGNSEEEEKPEMDSDEGNEPDSDQPDMEEKPEPKPKKLKKKFAEDHMLDSFAGNERIADKMKNYMNGY